MSPALAFCEFIDRTLQRFQTSPEYRAAFLSELPDGVPFRLECPDFHPHGVTATCYGAHKCRCMPCRVAASARQKAGRARRYAGRNAA